MIVRVRARGLKMHRVYESPYKDRDTVMFLYV